MRNYNSSNQAQKFQQQTVALARGGATRDLSSGYGGPAVAIPNGSTTTDAQFRDVHYFMLGVDEMGDETAVMGGSD